MSRQPWQQQRKPKYQMPPRQNQSQNNKPSQPTRSLSGLNLDRFADLFSYPLGQGKKKDSDQSTGRVREIIKEIETDKDPGEQEICQAVLNDFVEKYLKNRSNTQYLQDLLEEEILSVCEYIMHYYDPAYTDNVESMNNVIKLFTTATFGLNLTTMIKKLQEDRDAIEGMKLPLSYAIGITLDTMHSSMSTDTINYYIELMSEIFYKVEIRELQDMFFLDEDSAIDIVIKNPLVGREIESYMVEQFAPTIKDLIMNHGRDVAQYLDAENQVKLFYYIFPNRNVDINIEILKQCFSEDMLEFEEELDQALYNEYITMLYTILDTFDLDKIGKLLRYIVKVRADIKTKESDTATTFNARIALDYDNVKKALLSYLETSENAKKFLTETE